MGLQVLIFALGPPFPVLGAYLQHGNRNPLSRANQLKSYMSGLRQVPRPIRLKGFASGSASIFKSDRGCTGLPGQEAS